LTAIDEHTGRREARGAGGPSRIVRIWLAAAVIGLLVVAGVWVVAFSPVLSVRSVQVKGAHRLDDAEVLAQAGVVDGTPLVRVSRGAVRGRVEKLPDVLAARVSVSFPSTVVITITERTASGYLQTGASTFVMVDETGHSFNTLAAKPAGLPLLAPAPGVSADAATFAAMAQVAVSVPVSVRPRLATVTATSADAVTLVLTDQRTVFWGGARENADKARLLPGLLAQPGQFYDISNPAQVYAR
jgi:cell division protein FtsQ